MKVGITLPQFRDDAEPAIEAALLAEAAGLDGVFVFDHLWPLGRPDRPALHGPTLLGALAAETTAMALGTLVARIGLVPDTLLVHQFATLHRMIGLRLIAGIGIGDHLSRPENEAYGVAFPPVEKRRAALASVCRSVKARGIEVWVGGQAPATRAIARTEAGVVNMWQVSPEMVSAEAARAEVSWAGQVDLSPDGGADVAGLLRSLGTAGATWAVLAPVGAPWPEAVETVAGAKMTSIHEIPANG